MDGTLSLTLIKGGIDRVCKAHPVAFLRHRQREAIHQNEGMRFDIHVGERLFVFQQIFNSLNLSFPPEAGITFLEQDVHFLCNRSFTIFLVKRHEHHTPGAIGQVFDIVNYVRNLVFFDNIAGYGRIELANPGEEEPQKLVNFRHTTHCGACVPGRNPLFDGYSRANPADIVHVRFFHTSEELACVARQTFDISTLSFSIQGIHSDAGLSRATHAGDNHQLVFRNLQIHILQIVGPGALDIDMSGIYEIRFECFGHYMP